MTNRASRRPLAGMVLTAVLIAGGGIGGAVGQDIPEGQSCGGLVCDLGLFGHKTAPKPAPAPPAPAVAAAPPKAAPPEPPRQAERKTPARKKAHVAKAAAAPQTVPPRSGATAPAAVAAAPPETATPSLAVPVSAIPVPSGIAAMPSIAASAEPPPPPRPVPITAPPDDGPVVMANPYVYTRPLPFMFQSVDPTQGVH